MDSSTEMTFGAWLRLRRRQLDLTQNELANRVGCSVMMIRKIESGERRPSRQIAELMADALEVPQEQREDFVRAARQLVYLNRDDLGAEPESMPPLPVSTPAEVGARLPARPLLALPHYPGAFVGRQAELEQIVQLLSTDDCRLLTLTGPGGSGKTRLAVETLQVFDAQDEPVFADGLVFLPLASLGSASLILPALANALGFNFHEGTDPLGQLLSYLQEQELLIVLDNFEHLLEGADLLAALLAHTAGVSVLVTSRQRLALSGEWVLEISGLAYPPLIVAEDDTAVSMQYSAVQLFLESARRARADFSLDPQAAAAIQQICQLVDGMPLGLELAAAWLRILSPAEIASEIQRNLDFLTSTARDVPERHRSLRAAFEHSWNLLSQEERSAFARLSVFRGGFDRPAAQEAAAAGLPVLASLLDKSLLRYQDERYYIHYLLRQYAAEKLGETPEHLAAAQQAHARFYARRLAGWEAELRGHGQLQALLEMDREVDNLRTAWTWLVASIQTDMHDRPSSPAAAESDSSADLALLQAGWFSMWFYWETRLLFQEGGLLFSNLVEALQGSDLPGSGLLQATARTCCGWFEMRRLRPNAAQQHLQRARLFMDTQPDSSQTLFVRLPQAFVRLRLGDTPGCQQLLEETQQRAADLGDSWLQAVCGHELCSLYIYRGLYQQAEQVGLQTLALAQEIGEPRRQMITSYHLASLYTHLQDTGRAQQYLDQSLALAEAIGDVRYLANLLRIRSRYFLAIAEYAAAAEDAYQTLEISQRIGDPILVFAAELAVGLVEQQSGNLQDAAHYFLLAYRLGREYKLETLQFNALVYLADTAWQAGSHAEAAALALRLEAGLQNDQELAKIAASLRRAAQEKFAPDFMEKLAEEARQSSLEALLARLSLNG